MSTNALIAAAFGSNTAQRLAQIARERGRQELTKLLAEKAARIPTSECGCYVRGCKECAEELAYADRQREKRPTQADAQIDCWA